MKAFQKKRSLGRKTYLVVIHLVFGVIAALLFACVFGFLVKWLWSVTLVPIFSLNPITYWQGVGLVLITRLLFGGLGTKLGHGSTHGHKFGHASREAEPSPEGIDTKALPSELSEYYNSFWKEEGRDAFFKYVNKFAEKENSNGETP